MMDANVSGIVFNVQKFSVHDGRGIRTLVFLKGCPLHCLWCSNPESQHLQPELAFNGSRCLTAAVCGRCAKACLSGAITVVDGLLRTDRSLCKGCFSCVKACPSGARNIYGETMTVDRILRRVEEDSIFYSRSGGGLTLSGGEALMQPGFVLALLREARRRHINTAIETSGFAPYEHLQEAIVNLNMLIMDIKSLDCAKHKEFTGVDNALILENFSRVCEEFPKLKILVRTPVIPGFNDSEDDIRAIRDFIPRRGNITYELLAYHRMGQPKYEYLGRRYALEGATLGDGLMDRLRAIVR